MSAGPAGPWGWSAGAAGAGRGCHELWSSFWDNPLDHPQAQLVFRFGFSS